MEEKAAVYLRIQDLAADERPREKMLQKGKNALSDAELLAILIGSGTRRKSALDLARELLQKNNHSLLQLASNGLQDLMKTKGIGKAKAITIAAALELARRLKAATQTQQAITSPKDAFAIFYPYLAHLSHEEFWILLLNRANKPICPPIQISKGGISGTTTDIRLIFKHAIEHLANSLIIAHNHPAGTPKPSESDKEITRRIADAGKLLDIKLLDHLILFEESYYSFSDAGLL
jgi:DNA repair protein RadC